MKTRRAGSSLGCAEDMELLWSTPPHAREPSAMGIVAESAPSSPAATITALEIEQMPLYKSPAEVAVEKVGEGKTVAMRPGLSPPWLILLVQHALRLYLYANIRHVLWWAGPRGQEWDPGRILQLFELDRGGGHHWPAVRSQEVRTLHVRCYEGALVCVRSRGVQKRGVSTTPVITQVQTRISSMQRQLSVQSAPGTSSPPPPCGRCGLVTGVVLLVLVAYLNLLSSIQLVDCGVKVCTALQYEVYAAPSHATRAGPLTLFTAMMMSGRQE
jgi:hypothetical protein